MEARAEEIWRYIGVVRPTINRGRAGCGNEESEKARGRAREGVWSGSVLGREADGPLRRTRHGAGRRRDSRRDERRI